ncbi:TA system antitoxin ParD family protein [Candidatus Poriferisodalis sp.]|uniref:TA system antitoxin ParD family protein n=1 Tax=Candidatus Poriferisodalis sp. TaxID=3101277 RepID=UPI003B011460
MTTSSSPIRIDEEIYNSAKVAARLCDRSIPQQVSHWARIGRALEMAPQISLADIQRVLDGNASYDDLNEQEQALVRARWDEIAENRRRSLNLAEEFRASGRQYSGLDDDGNVVVFPSREAGALASP